METKTKSLWRHFGLAALILVISFALFTLLPGALPHPEDFSPYAYTVAFLACLVVWLGLDAGRHKRIYLPILLLCLLAFLDEAGYGSEILGLQPFYSQTLHTEVRDLHNAIALLAEVMGLWLKELRWNWPLFIQFLTFDAFLLVAAFGFGWWMRRGLNRAKENRWQQRILRLAAGFIAASGLVAAGYLVMLPRDSTNAWLLGFSAGRLLSAVGMLLVSLLPVGLLAWKAGSFSPFAKAFARIVTKSWVSWLLVAAMLAGLAYQFWAPLHFLPDDRIRLERITPLVLWAQAVAVGVLVAVLAWKGAFRRNATQIATGVLAFFRREPAFFYALFAVVLIFVAQLNDKDILPLDTIIRTPDFHIKRWGLWTEEVFEMTGAFLFIIAGGFFKRDKR